MMELYLLTGVLAVFVAVLLLGFVGCGLDVVGTMEVDYPKTILKTPNLITYWSLGEPKTVTVPSSGGQARSKTNTFHGDFARLTARPADETQQSPPTTGQITLGETPGLLGLMKTRSCLKVDGGFVKVPFNIKLNPPQFTLEAWVDPDPSMAKGYFYCLVDSTGPAQFVPKKTGWALYLGPDNPDATPPGNLFWQIWMGNGTQLKRVAIAKGASRPTKLQLTYLALTFDGKNLQLWLYYPKTKQQLDIKYLRGAQNSDVSTTLGGPFKPNDASADGQGPFIIGAGTPLFPVTAPVTQRLYPFKGKIQEVALYQKDLAGPPPHFEGVTNTLAFHVMAGGEV